MQMVPGIAGALAGHKTSGLIGRRDYAFSHKTTEDTKPCYFSRLTNVRSVAVAPFWRTVTWIS